MKAVAQTQDTPIATQPVIRILKTASCPSLSGKSSLTYQVGCNPESDIYLRIHANKGGGFFSNEWVALGAIRDVLEHNASLTCFSFVAVFKGKSTNTPGFMLAVLKQEGMVIPSTDVQRRYVMSAPDSFMAEVHALMDAPEGQSDGKQKRSGGGKKSAANASDNIPENSPL